MNRGVRWFALSCLVLGCSSGGSKGSPRDAASEDVDSSVDATEDSSAESASDMACMGTLEDVGPWALPCPSSLCDAEIHAAGCRSMDGSITKVTKRSCVGITASTFVLEFSGPDASASCWYRNNQLVAASAFRQESSFCGGTSRQIRSGSEPTVCSDKVDVICDRSTPDTGADTGQAGIPAAKCLSNFDGTCRPCCADVSPDCTGKADGYPGYACNLAPMNSDAGEIGLSSCSCACLGERWQCGC